MPFTTKYEQDTGGRLLAEVIDPRMLARLARATGLGLEDL
jgi:hypothetical protein